MRFSVPKIWKYVSIILFVAKLEVCCFMFITEKSFLYAISICVLFLDTETLVVVCGLWIISTKAMWNAAPTDLTIKNN